jgi:hypothetical protein
MKKGRNKTRAGKAKEPSPASLREMPEVAFEGARVRRNPYAARTAADAILQLKVTLVEVEPRVWRRLLVPAGITLAKLHAALQDAMGWTNSHLHSFEVAGRRIGMVGVEEDSPELEDERRVKVSSVLPKKGATLVYRYDYGDDWEHLVEVEEVTSPDRRHSYPLCIAGARACPPEDCGGPFSYGEFIKALADPRHEEHDQNLTWVGGHFDPDSFDVNAVNRLLRGGR